MADRHKIETEALAPEPNPDRERIAQKWQLAEELNATAAEGEQTALQSEPQISRVGHQRCTTFQEATMVEQRIIATTVERRNGCGDGQATDLLAVEEALEIRLGYVAAAERAVRSVTVMMRTPGSDHELAAGFLFTEGFIDDSDDIAGIRHCDWPAGPLRLQNVIRVELRPGAKVDLTRLERNFISTSSCDVCGKASLEALPRLRRMRLPDGFAVPAAVIHDLPTTLRRAQTVFDSTGGLHAAALFDRAGQLLDVREDVGRHNALDKVIGRQVIEGAVPLSDSVLLVSGRVGYELVQKAIVAGIPILAAIGAPSSLAVELANDANMMLAGFVREHRFNVYSAAHRIIGYC
jgi:FdhD protein